MSWPRIISFVIMMSYDTKSVSPESTSYLACSTKIFSTSAAILCTRIFFEYPAFNCQ